MAEPTGSIDVQVRPTDALANERTYLAYVRTALAFVAFGFVVARFALFTREISVVAHITVPQTGISRVFGIAMVFAGVVVAIVGGFRYGATDRALKRGESRALSPAWAYVGAALLALIGAIVAFEIFRF
jgi:putative membrane protein